MKKILSLLLAFVMCLSLCACSVTEEDIAGVYNGGYSYEGDDYEQTFFVEEDGTYTRYLFKNGALYKERTGQYEINGNEVQFHDDDGYTPLEYKDGKLTSPSSSYQHREYIKVNEGEDAYSAYINSYYTTYLAGKVFEQAESFCRTLTFDDDLGVTYHYIDGLGVEYTCTYSVEGFVEFKAYYDTITMQVSLKEIKRDGEVITAEEIETVVHRIYADAETMEYSIYADTVFFSERFDRAS